MLLRKGYSFEIIHIALDETEWIKQMMRKWKRFDSKGKKLIGNFHSYSGFEYKQKMKQTLYRKGFSMDLIERFLAEKENS